MNMKLTPTDVEIPIPKFFVLDNIRDLKDRETFLHRIIDEAKPPDDEAKAPPMTRDEAICLIQRHERARQGRMRALFMLEVQKQEQKGLNILETKQLLEPEQAVTIIQKIWRGILTRREVAKMRREEMIWLGMIPNNPQQIIQQSNIVKLADRIETSRRITQEIYQQDYEEALVEVKQKILDSKGREMRSNMQDQIRQWFVQVKETTGTFPVYPDEAQGGSAILFKEKTPEERELEAKEKEEALKKEKDAGKPAVKPKETDKKKGNEDEYEGWKMSKSLFLDDLRQDCEVYRSVWLSRDQSNCSASPFDHDLIHKEKYKEVESQMRHQIDELMQQELRNLKIAVDKEKVRRVGKRKIKGKKGKKGRRGKKDKDLTPDRTLLSLYEELATAGIIKPYEKVQLTDYVGGYSYLGTTMRDMDMEPQPSLSEVRRLVAEYAIMPLGSDYIHEKSPLVKSLLLTGPKGSGKRMLVNAICTATGANLFDLSADNLVNKYPGKAGSKLLVNTVFKVARHLQPSVIMVNDCEKMLRKRTSKTDLTEPKRIKKDLVKAVKGIGPTNRILLVGCSSAPFEAEVRPFCSLYQKIILIPRPDYISRHLAWRTLVIRHGGHLTDALDIASLSKISDGFTIGHIDRSCREVLSERRLVQQNRRPLKASEFIQGLSQFDPVYVDEEEAYKNWHRKTPLGKQRALAMEMEAEAAKEDKKKDKKGKR